MPARPTDSDSPPRSRLPSIDVLRGAAMVLMALDHTRDYFTGLTFDPENLERTWAALFVTRWVTHFCAPLFFFLAGTAAYLRGKRQPEADLRRFLWTRGLWLIALEFSVVGTGWTFRFPWGFFGVIFCLGAAMILLAPLTRLPIGWLAGISLALVAGHDLLDELRPEAFGRLAWLWGLLHVKGPISLFGHGFYVLFPVVPWCAVMSLGYSFGALLSDPRRRWVPRLGLAATALFVLLRTTNLYGNPPALPGGVTPGDFALQPTLVKSVILFLDTEKYPPSLQFLLMTLGPSLLALAWLESRRSLAWARPLQVFGRVPLFFYLLHLYLIHGLAVAVAGVAGRPFAWLLDGAFWFHEPPVGYGYGLPLIYLMWALAVALLYPPCAWFARLKRGSRAGWLTYL